MPKPKLPLRAKFFFRSSYSLTFRPFSRISWNSLSHLPRETSTKLFYALLPITYILSYFPPKKRISKFRLQKKQLNLRLCFLLRLFAPDGDVAGDLLVASHAPLTDRHPSLRENRLLLRELLLEIRLEIAPFLFGFP